MPLILSQLIGIPAAFVYLPTDSLRLHSQPPSGFQVPRTEALNEVFEADYSKEVRGLGVLVPHRPLVALPDGRGGGRASTGLRPQLRLGGRFRESRAVGVAPRRRLHRGHGEDLGAAGHLRVHTRQRHELAR